MSRAKVRLRTLADEAELDYEDALVLLWDGGIEGVDAPDDFVPRNRLSAARRALGLRTAGPVDRRPVAAKVLDGSPDVATPSATAPPLVWRTVGSPSDVSYLVADNVLAVHEALVRDFARSNDPISPPGLRDRNLLDSALYRPHTPGGKYPTVSMAAAAVFHSLTLNHAFANGNKRTALVSLLVFLEQNGRILEATEPELFRYVLQVASHRLVTDGPERADREVLAIADWLESRLSKVGRGEKRLRFSQLRPILASYGCTIKILSGNRALLSRAVARQRWFGAVSTLKCHVWYGDEGREVDTTTIQKIRAELWLDEEHGYDSTRFYEARPGVDEFIAMYRKTLRRLARV